jgi:hypothetical protein
MAMVAVGGRIPQSLYEAMRAYGEETGQSDSELVRDAILLLITGKEPEPARLDQRMKRLESQVRKLQKVAMG